MIESQFDLSNTHIHGTDDVIKYLSFDHMLEHARMTTGLVYELAHADFDKLERGEEDEPEEDTPEDNTPKDNINTPEEDSPKEISPEPADNNKTKGDDDIHKEKDDADSTHNADL